MIIPPKPLYGHPEPAVAWGGAGTRVICHELGRHRAVRVFAWHALVEALKRL